MCSLRLKRSLFYSRVEAGFDLVVIGGGPAGIGAALQASRLGLKTILVADRLGGLLTEAWLIDNYLGFSRIEASRLLNKFIEHLAGMNVPVLLDYAEGFSGSNCSFTVRTRRGSKLAAKAIIVAIGLKRRKLGVPGEEEYVGKGVSYCAVCDAPLYRGAKAVAVIGGGDSAIQSALLLSSYANRVYIVHRREEYRALKSLVEAMRSKNNIVELKPCRVKRIIGNGSRVKALELVCREGETRIVEVDGVFIEVGFEPNRDWAIRNKLKTDEDGYIVVDEWMNTNIPGVFAAGDCTSLWKGYRQIQLAVAMGFVAAYSAYQHIQRCFSLGCSKS